MKRALSFFVSAILVAFPSDLLKAQAKSPTPSPARVDAREVIPPTLIGSWKLSLSESTYAPGTRVPKMQYRTFDYTADGMLLCDYITASADGNQASGNWTSSFDGVWRAEYMRVYGATPFAMVQVLKTDEHTLALKAAKHGVVFEYGDLKLSDDGNTLTFTYFVKDPAGEKKNIAVYHRWNLTD